MAALRALGVCFLAVLKMSSSGQGSKLESGFCLTEGTRRRKEDVCEPELKVSWKRGVLNNNPFLFTPLNTSKEKRRQESKHDTLRYLSMQVLSRRVFLCEALPPNHTDWLKEEKQTLGPDFGGLGLDIDWHAHAHTHTPMQPFPQLPLSMLPCSGFSASSCCALSLPPLSPRSA